jgi:hypothetical protein
LKDLVSEYHNLEVDKANPNPTESWHAFAKYPYSDRHSGNLVLASSSYNTARPSDNLEVSVSFKTNGVASRASKKEELSDNPRQTNKVF